MRCDNGGCRTPKAVGGVRTLNPDDIVFYDVAFYGRLGLKSQAVAQCEEVPLDAANLPFPPLRVILRPPRHDVRLTVRIALRVSVDTCFNQFPLGR